MSKVPDDLKVGDEFSVVDDFDTDYYVFLVTGISADKTHIDYLDPSGAVGNTDWNMYWIYRAGT